MPDDLTPLGAVLRPSQGAPSPHADLQAILEAMAEGPRAEILAAFQRLQESRSAAEAQAKYYQGRMLWAREALSRLYAVARDLEAPCDCGACAQCDLQRALDAADDALNHLPPR